MTDVVRVPTTDAPSRSDRLDQALRQLLAQTRELEAAAVVSFDGLPMASALPPSMDEDRVAAMSAALLSLGERAAQGLGRGELSQVFIEGDEGTVFLVSCDDEAVLVAVAARGAKMGMMLYEVRRAAAAVAEALRADDAAPVAAVEVAEPEPEPAVMIEPPAPVQQWREEAPLLPTQPVGGWSAHDPLGTDRVWSSAYGPESDGVAPHDEHDHAPSYAVPPSYSGSAAGSLPPAAWS